MVVRIPIKGLIIFGIIIVVGFWLLEITKTPASTLNLTSSLNQSPPQNLNPQNILSGETREIEVTARQFSFTPNPIRVKLGEMIRLKIKSLDVVHGFSLPEFGINEILQPGKEIQVEFQATRKGSFQFFCSVVCGLDHSGMRGTLIVE